MADPIRLAVVGHTNAGKTSVLRTLTRHASFGEVSERPGTTRHVETIDLKIDGVSMLRFFDTPGLEDSVTLLDYLKSLPDCATPPDRVRAFLAGPEAQRGFEQEAKVLRQMLAAHAAVYVIDTREPVLPKFRAEIEILASCARPIMPVLNFVRHPDTRKTEWMTILSAYSLHTHVQFDAVAPFIGSERELYQDLATLLRERRPQLTEVIADLELQFTERRSAASRAIAAVLVDAASLRRQIGQAEFEIASRKEAFVREFRTAVTRRTRDGIDDLLLIFGFDRDDADAAALPWLDGRWEADLFNPETLRDASRRLGAGAAVGAAIGLAADIALAGLSLGTGSAIGAALGGIASQGWGQFGRRLLNRGRGVRELTLENEVLLVIAEQMLHLLRALERRGHAAVDRIAPSPASSPALRQTLRALIGALQPARGHPEWTQERSGNLRRDRFVDAIGRRVLEAASHDEAPERIGSAGRPDPA